MPPSSPGYRPDLQQEQSWILRQARRLLGRRLRSAMDSQDLSQEAQLAAVKHLGKREFENQRAFRGWLQRILSNRARDAARSQIRAVHPVDASFSSIAGHDSSPSQYMQQLGEDSSPLGRKLAHLPERTRMVLRLRLTESLSFGEIARRMGLTEVNARLIFHRAIKELRDNLGKRTPMEL